MEQRMASRRFSPGNPGRFAYATPKLDWVLAHSTGKSASVNTRRAAVQQRMASR